LSSPVFNAAELLSLLAGATARTTLPLRRHAGFWVIPLTRSEIEIPDISRKLSGLEFESCQLIRDFYDSISRLAIVSLETALLLALV
jgi:hypothetical protein